ncbi:MAG: chemotaxis protein CheW [bacterium]|nr:chemotaxis protein CheW [bacterium]
METAVSKKQTAGKYLTFRFDREEYGIEILRVCEIIGMMDVTRVPHTADYILGVINLRGKVIPVINLRRKFGLPDVEVTNLTCIIVIDVHHVQIGIVVDEVSEVIDIHSEEIENAPEFGSALDTSIIQGIGKVKERVIILLEIEKVLQWNREELDTEVLTAIPNSI